MPDLKKLDAILDGLKPYNARLVAVSKTKPAADIRAVLDHGHADFGENYVQELVSKQPELPSSVNWHFIGHLQSNKVKLIAGFIHLIHGVDSLSALKEINKQAAAHNRDIEVLIQVHIAREESKYGVTPDQLPEFLSQAGSMGLDRLRIRGLMGMATFTDDENIIRTEFRGLRKLYDSYASETFNILSMGMSSDYLIALDEGSNMVRIGSMIFGDR